MVYFTGIIITDTVGHKHCLLFRISIFLFIMFFFFCRFGIEAVSLEGFDNAKDGAQRNFYHVGRVVESIVRSLNNLLERFHQSFFFYLLPCTDRYISIGNV